MDLKAFSPTKVSTTTVDLNGTGQTTLYTVPTDKTFVPVMAILRAADDCGESIITMGASGTLTDFLGSQTLGNIDGDGDMAILMPVPNATPVLLKTYAAGTLFQIDVTTALGAAGNSLDLFGWLF